MEKVVPRILFVDDETSILNSLKRLFRREPYEIEFASNGEEALEVFRRLRPSVVVSDQRMPKMSGIELLSKVKALDEHTVRIILTGFTDMKVAEDAINQGEVYRFVTKPWNDDDLKAAVAAGVDRYRLVHENQRLVAELKSLNVNLEEKVAERTRELRQRQAELVQSEKLAGLGMLAGGVAHEINNPLGGILALSQILLQEIKDPSQREDLRQVEEAALRCKRIVRDLLDFSRSSQSEDHQETQLGQLFDKAISLVLLQSKGKKISVHRNFDEELPSVCVNPNRVQQVLLNLLANAVQAVDERQGEIVVSTERQNGFVVATVEDNGPGIPGDVRDRIFDPFFTTKPQGEGTGLGLSVSYGIIQDHGGKIEVNCPSKGAQFKVFLPLGKEGN